MSAGSSCGSGSTPAAPTRTRRPSSTTTTPCSSSPSRASASPARPTSRAGVSGTRPGSTSSPASCAARATSGWPRPACATTAVSPSTWSRSSSSGGTRWSARPSTSPRRSRPPSGAGRSPTAASPSAAATSRPRSTPEAEPGQIRTVGLGYRWHMANPDVFTMVLAGGEGKRLSPLTADRAKPAVPFGGDYRLVDFVLSNLVNGDYTRIAVLTQYKSHSLDRHVTTTWRLSPLLGGYVTPVPAQMRRGPRWYAGSADAIFQSLNLVYDERPDYVIVFGADHVYRMDPSQMVGQHVTTGAGVTVAGIRVPRATAGSFGCIEADAAGAITRFLEKPIDPPAVPDDPEVTFASMGNYVFSTDVLLDALASDARNSNSDHDMGGDIIPMLVERGEAAVYDFADNVVPGATERDRGYWRDVGTIDAYYDAHMDLVSVHPVFNLYNERWPIFTLPPQLPPAQF